MILLNYAPACLLSLLHKVVSDISKFHFGTRIADGIPFMVTVRRFCICC